MNKVDCLTDEGLLALRAEQPEAWFLSAKRPADVLGYLEVHIEQGPVLEQENEPLGVVSALASQGPSQR